MNRKHPSVILGGLLLVATAFVLGVPSSQAATPSVPDTFAGVSGPGATLNPTFVGKDSSGTSVALVITGLKSAVAYACDGTGKVSTWFQGVFDAKSGVANLTGPGGASLGYDLRKKSGTLTLGAARTAFTLERASGISGLYRKAELVDAGSSLIGWIARNDGRVVGTVTLAGKTLASVSESPNQPLSATGTPATTTSIAVTTFGFFKNLQCGALTLREGFNLGQLTTAEANNNTAGITDANNDQAVITAKQTRAGCVASLTT